MKLYQVQNNQREKNVDAMFFCCLQVSNKFARTATLQERLLIDLLISSYDHRTLHGGAEALARVVERISVEVGYVNCFADEDDRKLVLTMQPLTKEQSGYIRIERQGGRHQSLLLPIVDLKGSVAV